MLYSDEIKAKVVELMNDIENVSNRKSGKEIFIDFLKLSCYAISNRVDKENYEVREKDYLHIIKSYDEKERTKLAHLLGDFGKILDECIANKKIHDILGSVYSMKKYYDPHKGQYFTPEHIASFMAAMTADYANFRSFDVQELSEPTCGSGIMVLKTAENMMQSNINYQNSLLVNAWDLDLTCVLMAYLQFSLYGIPAIVVHGNSINQEIYSQWITPMMCSKDLYKKLQIKRSLEAIKEMLDCNENEKIEKVPVINVDKTSIEFHTKKVKKVESISLF